MLSLGPNGEAKDDYPRSWLGKTKYDLNVRSCPGLFFEFVLT